MTMVRTVIGVMVVCGLLLAAGVVSAQEKKAPPAPPAKAPAAPGEKKPGAETKPGMPGGEMSPEMKAAMEAMQPGPAHEKLAKLAGEWTYKTKLSGAGMPPEETEGTAKITVVMDGRFIHEEAVGTMMGMPFKGARLMGYNSGAKKYEAVWTYSLGTNMMTMSGPSEDAGKTIKMNASFENEMGAKETVNVTYKIADDDHFTVIMDGGKMPDGTPGPVMETNYARKK
jgi:hypothetical protein